MLWFINLIKKFYEEWKTKGQLTPLKIIPLKNLEQIEEGLKTIVMF